MIFTQEFIQKMISDLTLEISCLSADMWAVDDYSHNNTPEEDALDRKYLDRLHQELLTAEEKIAYYRLFSL